MRRGNSQALEQARKQIEPVVKVKGLSTTKTLVIGGEDSPKIQGELRYIQEALTNVMYNAVKYSTGTIPDEIDLVHKGCSVVTRINSYGIELPRDCWKAVFEEAYRARTAIRLPIDGSGLGLYISRRFLLMCGGDISVESSTPCDDGTPRWRTTFLLTFCVKDFK